MAVLEMSCLILVSLCSSLHVPQSSLMTMLLILRMVEAFLHLEVDDDDDDD